MAFLNNFDQDKQIKHVVDINPHRQGHYMPLTGQQIVSPEQLKAIQPDIVIIMNAIYVSEIQDVLANLKLIPEVITLE